MTLNLPLSRRILLSLIPLAGLATLALADNAAKLSPGRFEWHPERSPEGPLLVVCSIDDQVLYAYRNGVLIARSTVSTGRKGKETPTGVFTILQRKIDHESNIYKGAKMPYMQRLTWTGIAMHAVFTQRRDEDHKAIPYHSHHLILIPSTLDWRRSERPRVTPSLPLLVRRYILNRLTTLLGEIDNYPPTFRQETCVDIS